MAQLSNHLENALMNHLYKNTQHTSSTSTYVALFNSDPAEDASGTECTGSGYVRMEMSASQWGTVTNGAVSNAVQITFPSASAGDWGTISHAAIFDSGSGGNMYHYGALNASVTVTNGDTFLFAAGQLTLSLE
jgi:hypothetical protein